MKYKNGREAKEGDYAIGIDYDKRVVVGVVHDILRANGVCQLATIVPGGVTHKCFTLENMYSAEDAMEAAMSYWSGCSRYWNFMKGGDNGRTD